MAIAAALNCETINPNLLNTAKYKLNFSRLPNTVYFCQSINIPGASFSEVMHNTPFIDLWVPGDKLVLDPLIVTFLIDEDLTTWREIYDWMRGMTFPTNFSEYRNLDKLNKYSRALSTGKPQYADCNVTLLDAANVNNVVFKFYDVFPTALSPFPLNSSDGPDTILTGDVTLRYNWFDIEFVG